MNIKMATNSQLSKTEFKKHTKRTTRTGTESQIQRSFGGLLTGRGKGKNRGNGAGIKKHNQQVQNRLGDVKNSIGNGEAKELKCTTYGHELREGLLERMLALVKGEKGENLGQL